MKKILLPLFLLLSLSGCGTMITVPLDNTPISPESATAVIFHSQGYRDTFNIYLDGVQQGSVTSEKPLKFEVSPGEHELSSRMAIVIDRITKFDFEAGKTYFFELRAEIGMWVSSIWIEPTSERDSYRVKSYRQ